MPENMLIPPLCEQLIGRRAAHQATRVEEAASSGASAWHSVHHRPHLATPLQLAASEPGGGVKKTHFCQLPLSASARTSRDVAESYLAKLVTGAVNLREYLAQLASFRDGERSKDTY